MTSTETETDELTTVQVYRVYIRATPERVWEAITSPSGPERYGYGGVDYDLRPGGQFQALASPELKRFGAPDADVRRRGAGGRPAPGADLAPAHGPRGGGRGLHPPHLRDRAPRAASPA